MYPFPFPCMSQQRTCNLQSALTLRGSVCRGLKSVFGTAAEITNPLLTELPHFLLDANLIHDGPFPRLLRFLPSCVRTNSTFIFKVRAWALHHTHGNGCCRDEPGVPMACPYRRKERKKRTSPFECIC